MHRRSLLRSFVSFCLIAIVVGILSTAAFAKSNPPAYLPVEDLTGYENVHGVVVCEPVADDRALVDFARGCGAWLELAISGRPEFGRTPPISELPRAMREMGRTDLMIDGPTATSLAHIVGVTDVVIGAAEGSTDHCVLTFQVYSVPTGQIRGAIVTAQGSTADVAAQLPRVASGLLKILGGTSARPPSQELSAGEISLIGQLWDVYDPAYVSEGQYEAIRQLAPQSALASILFLRFLANTSETEARIAVNSIYRHAPDNLMAVAEAYELAPGQSKTRAARIKAHRKSYPQNFLAALTSTWLAQSEGNETAIRTAAEGAVCCAPDDPFSWETLSEAISNDAVSLRHGRSIGSLKKTERDALDHLYDLGVASLQRAVEDDPLDGSACLHLSIAAAFAGNQQLAMQAYLDAIRGKVDRYAAYSWALQMFGKQWYNLPPRLAEIVHDARSATFDNDSETIGMASDLRAAGFGDDANALLAGAIASTQYTLSGNPSDGYADWRLAAYFRAVGNLGQAITSYQEAEKYITNRPDLYVTDGLALDAAGRFQDAISQYRMAVKLDPMYETAHACLGQDLLSVGSLKEAAVEIERTVALDPTAPTAHYGRARLLYARGDVHGANVEFRRAINLSSGAIDMYYQICWTLDAAGHYPDCLKYASEALRLHPGTIPIMEQAADAYLNLKHMRDAVRLLQAVLAINPNDAWAHEKLGEAYVRTGDRGSARNEWQTVLALGDATMGHLAQQMLDKYPP